MANIHRNSERGMALLFTLLTLLILSAIAATLVTMTNTESTVNSNYRAEEMSFFAARAGAYEATDRMMQANASSIAGTVMSATGGAPFGAVVPSATNHGIVYLINQTSATGTVAPWDITNKYADTELCHEGYTLAGMTNATPDVPCTTLPTGSTWYTTATSNAPWNGTNAALPYEWVRVNWKLNNSLSYLTATTVGGVTTTSTSYYGVNGTGSSPICYNGSNEVVLNYPTNTSCNLLTTGGTADTPVFLVTALAITSTGARQMVQAEMAAPPPTVTTTPGGFSDPDGFFAASNGCASPPLLLAGNASVDGYSTAVVAGVAGTYASTHSASLGNVGSNGSVSMQGSSTNVGGKIHVLHTTVNGTCPNSDVFTTGSPTYGSVVQLSSAFTPPVPSIPAAGTTNENISSAVTLAPGSYRNVQVSGNGAVLTLTGPGVFNVDCLSVATHAQLQISPASTQVVINVTGDAACGGTPISFDSHGTVNNTSGIAANLLINYAGTQPVGMVGGSSAYYVLNAPNAAVTMNGGTDFYGAIIASTIDNHGGTNLHFDNALTVSNSPATTTYASITTSYNTIGFRSLPY